MPCTMTLGLSLKLSPEAASALQQRISTTIIPEHENSEDFSPNDSISDENGMMAASHQNSLQQQDGEDWDNTIAVPPEYLNEFEGNDDDSNYDGDDGTSQESDDEISLAPPASLPVVVVNLQRLCGFTPSTFEESEQIRQQLISSLCQDDDGINIEEQQHDEYDSLARNFDARVKELFEHGIANHGDTSKSEKDDLAYTTIEYPEFLCRSDADPPRVIVTAREWKRLLKPHRIPIVNKLLSRLKDCNRPLSWKLDMHEELLKLVKREESYRKFQQEQQSLHFWRTERRKQQLDKLYQVREMFDHRLEVARGEQECLEVECDEATANELRRLRDLKGELGGLQALDFDTNMFSYGENVLLETNEGVNNDSSNVDGSFSSHSGYDHEIQSDSDASVSGDNVDNTKKSFDSTFLTVDNKERSRARRKATQKAQNCRLESQQEAAREMALLEQAHAEEERVREACTSPELRMAQATVKSLEKRLQQVDDLLESLQEEEWADEEDGMLQTISESAGGRDTVGGTSSSALRRHDSNQFSLLDSILGMILGSLPQSTNVSTEEHYKYACKQHNEIVNEWKAYFGRLPAPFEGDTIDETTADDDSGKQAPVLPAMQESPDEVTTLRETLGIADNTVKENWDDADDWDETVASDTKKATPNTSPTINEPKKQIVGLRPGGTVLH